MISTQRIEDIFEEFPSHLTHKIKKNYPDTYEYIDEHFEGDTFTEKVYQYAYGEENKYCELEKCSKQCVFQNFGKGYNKYCSYNCSGKAKRRRVENECSMCGETFITVKSRARDYCSEECRRKYFKTEECKKKKIESHKETVRKKYGTDFYVQTDEFKEKAKQTKIERYGRENYVNAKKAKETKKEKYGDSNYINLKKQRKTLKEKFTARDGVDEIKNASQTVEYKNKLTKNQLKTIDQRLLSHIEREFSEKKYRGVEDENGKSIHYKFYCKNCNSNFKSSLNDGNNPLCPKCDKGGYGRSKKETDVYKLVKSILDTEVYRSDQSVLDGSKELDIFIPSKQIAIEFDGLYWHSELQGEKEKDYHLKKTQACESEDIHLIHIFENEWTRKQDIVKSRLRHILGQSTQKPIYARNCSVKQIDTQIKSDFLKKHHLQGAGRSKVKLGIFHGEFFDSKLVGVMTFGTPSVAQGHKEDGRREQWEMKRFALSRPVVGAAGKLFKHFTRNFDPAQVKTYADRRWSTKLDNVYEKIGFQHVGSSEPNYYYFDREKGATQELKHRFNFRKNVLDEKLEYFNPDLTEWENMQKNGYDRMWDCGHLKYRWTRR